MARTPQEVEALFQNSFTSHDGPHLSGPDEDGTITVEERTWRVLKLREVLVSVQQAWLSGSSALDLITEKLADGSRDASWRAPLGDAGVLDFYLSILPIEGLRQALKIHTLRLIGNACADTDENRYRIVQANHLRVIISLLADDSTLAFVIPVIYNICVDYEPAQEQACNNSLSVALVNLISGPRLFQCQHFLNIICKILGLLVTQDVELKVANPSTPSLLLGLATSRTYPPDLEDFCGLTSAALAYLVNEQFQTHLLTTGSFGLLQQAFHNSYTQFDIGKADQDEAAQLKQIWNTFVQIFADISALPIFSILNPIDASAAVNRLVAWLASPASFTHLQTAACLSLGNLCRSDESSTALLHKVFPALVSILNKAIPPISPSSPSLSAPTFVLPQLLHAVLSFLKNLAIPAVNKPRIGAVLLDPPLSALLPRLWSVTSSQPDAQFAAVSLTRLLVSNCPANAARLCAPLSADPDSPAHARSNLHKLIDVALSSDAEPTKIESGRAIASICRMLHSGRTPVEDVLSDGWDTEGASTANTPATDALTPPTLSPGSGSSPTSRSPSQQLPGGLGIPEDSHAPHVFDPDEEVTPARLRRANFYAAHAEMVKPLKHLLVQRKFPTVRSEALFIFALMSRSSDGVKTVVMSLRGPETLRGLVEAITGRDLIDGHELGLGLDGKGPGAGEMDVDGPAGTGSNLGMPTSAPPSGSSQAKSNLDAEAEAMVKDLGLEPQQADPAQTAAMKRVDRENGLVLVAEVWKRYKDDLPPFGRNVIEELLNKGGELVMHERKAQGDSQGYMSS